MRCLRLLLVPSMAPVHALGLAELDTGVAAQRLEQARDMELSLVQVSHTRNAVQTGLPAEHNAKDTAPGLELGRSESPSTHSSPSGS